MTRFTRSTRAAALAAALLVSAGCATKGDLRDVRFEMQRLASRQDSLLAVLERQSALTQDTLRRQNNQLFEIRGDVSRQLQQILDELATLRELAGQNQRTIAALRDQVERLSRSGAASGPSNPSEAIVGGGPGGGSASGGAVPTYNMAVEAYQRGSIATAQAAFEDFVRDYGSHELAPDAHFYLGNIAADQERFEDALAAFAQIPELFPTHPRVPDALYRLGLLHLELDDEDEARRSFERVVNSYPDSDAASLAREQLRELR